MKTGGKSFSKVEHFVFFDRLQLLGHGALYSIILYVWFFLCWSMYVQQYSIVSLIFVQLYISCSVQGSVDQISRLTYSYLGWALLSRRTTRSLCLIFSTLEYFHSDPRIFSLEHKHIFTRTQEYFHSDPRIFSLGPQNIFTWTQEYFHSDPRIISLGHKNKFTRTQEYLQSDPRIFWLGPKNIFARTQEYFHSDPRIFSLKSKNIFQQENYVSSNT